MWFNVLSYIWKAHFRVNFLNLLFAYTSFYITLKLLDTSTQTQTLQPTFNPNPFPNPKTTGYFNPDTNSSTNVQPQPISQLQYYWILQPRHKLFNQRSTPTHFPTLKLLETSTPTQTLQPTFNPSPFPKIHLKSALDLIPRTIFWTKHLVYFQRITQSMEPQNPQNPSQLYTSNQLQIVWNVLLTWFRVADFGQNT